VTPVRAGRLPIGQMTTYPHAATVVLTYEDVAMTRDCLRSVLEADYASDRHTVYLVDNHSRRVSVEGVAAEFPTAVYIRNDANLGFAAGMNVGIRRALQSGASYIYVLNNDTQVHQNYLTSVVEAMETDPTVGVCGSMILDYHDHSAIQEIGYRLEIDREFPIPRARGERDAGQHDCLTEVDTLCGGALCLRASLLPRVGLFDPSFFCYWEDTDLCLRIRQGEQRVMCQGKSKVYHWGNFTAGSTSRLFLYCSTRNYLWLAKRHGFGPAALKLKLRRLPRTMGWLLLKARRGFYANAYFRGLVHGHFGSPLNRQALIRETSSPQHIPCCPYS
jgi:GT2 family glycosyltransferase